KVVLELQSASDDLAALGESSDHPVVISSSSDEEEDVKVKDEYIYIFESDEEPESDEECYFQKTKKVKREICSDNEDETPLFTKAGSPIYETPLSTYKCEEIIEILLNKNIDEKKVCHERPRHIEESATFVINLDSLRHPDDVKKDDFGKWKYSGSHLQSFLFSETENGDIEVKKIDDTDSCSSLENVIQLRRIHCKHPSNSQFQKLMAFVS
uniref:Uncharacterized protein n=1 Tax=Amphimedon queenslandica TaxID=400682 RepID=A0A1X7SN02_AMPQE